MFIVSYRLLNLLNDADYDSLESHLAQQLLSMVEELDRLSIDVVSARCHVSKSTLSKFVKNLGFSDYREFRENARNEKRRSGYHRYEQMLPMGRCIWQLGMDSYLPILKKDIDDFMQQIDRRQIRQLAQAIHRFEKVAAYGAVYSQTVAMDFVYRMAEEGRFIKTNTYDVKQEQTIRQAGEDTLIILFSNSGQYLYENGMKNHNMSQSFIQKSRASFALITSNPEAAADPRVTFPVLYRFHSIVQNHPIIERLVSELIVYEYKQLTPQKDN